jgi:broad specificity phosphatase PhoE
MKNKLVYFITHPDVIVDPNLPIPAWSLSERGKQRVRSLLVKKWVGNIGSLYCSKEKKSIDTAEIIKEHIQVNYSIIDSLGEIDRSKTGYLPPDKHLETVKLFYAFPNISINGRERAIDAQNRIIKTVQRIVDLDFGTKEIAIISHGGIAALFLAYLSKEKIDVSFGQPDINGGCYFIFNAKTYQLISSWQSIG